MPLPNVTSLLVRAGFESSIVLTAIGAGAGALLGGIFGGGNGAGIGSVVGGVGGLRTTAFHRRQKITLSSGQEMLIRITERQSRRTIPYF